MASCRECTVETEFRGCYGSGLLPSGYPTAYLNADVTRMHSACEDDTTHADDTRGLLRN